MDKEEKQQAQDQILKRGLGTEVVANVVGGIASGAAAVVVQQGLTKLGSNDKKK
jgi:hypothetical protein